MGRGVNTVSNSEYVGYIRCAFDEFDEFGESVDEVIDDLIYSIKLGLPSLDEPWKSVWDGEAKLVLENNLVNVWLSEYCGTISVCVTPVEDDGYNDRYFGGLSINWINQVSNTLDKILKSSMGTAMNKLGTMSNGVSVFENA